MSISLIRPVIVTNPSASARAMSPVRKNPRSSNASAVSPGRWRYPIMMFGPFEPQFPVGAGPDITPRFGVHDPLDHAGDGRPTVPGRRSLGSRTWVTGDVSVSP